MKKIILLGYMGCGKSTIAKELSNQIQVPFTDLDHFIESQENRSISKIFQEKGEIYFRKKENLYLQSLLEKKGDLIIALGGGTPCYGNNMDIIKKHGISFFLKPNASTLLQRLVSEKSKRPLIAHLEDNAMEEFIYKHLFERNPFYQQASHTIAADEKTPQDIALEIVRLIG